jgi:predicted small lipoprotein YifL
MKTNLRSSMILAAAIVLTACGGGGGGEVPKVAAADTKVAASAAATTAVTSVPFVFASGVPDFGTTSSTSLAFTSTGPNPAFAINAVGQGTASGTTAFGSCDFTITASTFPSTHPLGVGKTVVIKDCSLNVNTAGAPANGQPVTKSLAFSLNGIVSVSVSVTVTVATDGTVVVNNVTVGTTPVNPVTGA